MNAHPTTTASPLRFRAAREPRNIKVEIGRFGIRSFFQTESCNDEAIDDCDAGGELDRGGRHRDGANCRTGRARRITRKFGNTLDARKFSDPGQFGHAWDAWQFQHSRNAR
jgi:hypothetical protein